jgi:signal transduction histidine kinase
MPARHPARPSYRRAILVYLIAIVGPTLVLLFLGLQSVQRQRQAISSLTESNLRLSGERLAGELERRVWQLAEACLRDGELAQLRLSDGEAETLETARQMRTLLARVAARHPIARHFFVLQDNAVRFPALSRPTAQPLNVYLANQDQASGRRFAALFETAEQQELNQQRPDLALGGYRQSYALPVAAALKALALARVARCLQKTNQPSEAEQAYRELAQKYGDLSDPFHRPYGLTAGLELDDLARAQGRPVVSDSSLADLYRELAQGRWELSAEQSDYFRARFEERLKAPQARLVETDFLSHLEMARALQEGFRHHGPLRAGQVYADAFTRGQDNYQTYYTLLPAAREPGALVGFAVNLPWVESQLLPQCRSELGMEESFGLGLRAASFKANAQETLAAFKTIFPFWELRVTAARGRAQQFTARREMWVFTGATLLILAVLGLGVFLLLRDVSREIQLGRLRADFVSSVSHELKTPLTLIRLYGETLLYGESDTEEERRSYYQIITRESERLTQLIERVLDFSRIERGQKQYHLREGDLAEVIARTVEVYGQYLTRQGFTVETELATELPPVRFDPNAVAEAVLNLLDNAAKYSGATKWLGIQLRAEHDQAVFEVADHGSGIPAGEREKIFQQFYRGRQHKEQGGYGLGLFLAKHTMEAHGGRIELESESGRGSRFRLIFPAWSAQVADAENEKRGVRVGQTV